MSLITGWGISSFETWNVLVYISLLSYRFCFFNNISIKFTSFCALICIVSYDKCRLHLIILEMAHLALFVHHFNIAERIKIHVKVETVYFFDFLLTVLTYDFC